MEGGDQAMTTLTSAVGTTTGMAEIRVSVWLSRQTIREATTTEIQNCGGREEQSGKK
jgi:hypothetical protein